MKVTYSSNNSGGSWPLSDDQWHALEDAGWAVRWVATDRGMIGRSSSGDGRWLGALAVHADREGLSLGDAIDEWERITSENSADLGCPCCGPPHSFEFSGDNGEWEHWSPNCPTTGERYR